MWLRKSEPGRTRETIAQAIADPITRLRFLRATAEPPRRRYGLPVMAVLVALTVGGWSRAPQAAIRPISVNKPPLSAKPATQPTGVWLVQSRSGQELYSNGLRVEAEGAVSNGRRSYRIFGEDASWHSASDPAGIVYHNTESHVAPFRAEENTRLLSGSESLVDYLRRHQSYHYLVDRFGRVFRIVAEADAADHAGNSVWSFNSGVCVNLNHAFLGVAFEGKTGESLSAAQLHSGRVLTDMLRARHHIDAANCVTHAQVSVNPYNMRIGWHTDWARGFAFAQLGLPANYEQPLASITRAGFVYDSAYLTTAGEELWIGLHRSDEQVRAAADRQGLTTAAYRKHLRRRYIEFTRNPS
jgi:hypothetical protein